MPYVNKDGVLVQKTPFSIYGLFWSIVNFCYLWCQSLINADFNKHGDKYTRTYSKPGGGPPRPPSRKFGGFNTGSSPGPSPAGGGGCGCGG
ncbi:hypothetical protein MSG28_001291 [Choristoneura fumiferana]|uniref:Uncharacterized protein n=2 Tax=Choristoneura fumiferana TaxID=7141 RepID=A0ACC0K4D6_CHOFU|nr:hypothetical protein MSG28_001290 [Choristoneura fumiferana]KAI8431264.1 hypothetical protein MSG28_001291 [Choristoneura fumiferana]